MQAAAAQTMLSIRAPPGLSLEVDARRGSCNSFVAFRPPPGLELDNQLDMCRTPSIGNSSSASMSECSSDCEGSADGDRHPMRETRTTLHLRNLPCYFTRDMMVKMLDAQGFKGEYDFVYLPMDFNTKKSLGYGFVNFGNSPAAVLFRAAMDGYTRWPIHSNKVCSVQWSSTQGLQRNIQLVRKSDVMKKAGIPEEFKPAVYENGRVAKVPAAPKKPTNKKPVQLSFGPFSTGRDAMAHFR